MTARDIPYIPETYLAEDRELLTVHSSSLEDPDTLQWLTQLAEHAIEFVCDTIAFRPERRLHVCVYHTNADAVKQLQRDVPATMAMAPFSNATASLIVLHSPNADVRNADRTRMQRILAHEFAHQAVAERTGSFKVLGDGNLGMHVSTWINEGFAEYVGLAASNTAGRVVAMKEQFATATGYYTFGTLSDFLDGLDNVARGLAFAHVTAAVRLLCDAHGIETVFHEISQFDRRFGRDEECNPSRIQQQ